MGLHSVSIGIKTFLRDDKLFNTISAIQKTLPETRMIIADDGLMTEEKDGIYADLVREGHEVIVLPFDSGFGAKSNRIAERNQNSYLLIGSDDFDFSPSFVRPGIEKLLSVLEETDIDIASGRVRGPYEFTLEDRGDEIVEHRVEIDPAAWYIECDLTVNYSLIKRRVFEKVKWDEDAKICQGEHGSFFVDVKRAGYRVAYVPGVRINEQTTTDSEEYRKYRSRGADSARSCFVRRNIRKYTLGNGKVDWLDPNTREPITR